MQNTNHKAQSTVTMSSIMTIFYAKTVREHFSNSLIFVLFFYSHTI